MDSLQAGVIAIREGRRVLLLRCLAESKGLCSLRLLRGRVYIKGGLLHEKRTENCLK